MFTRRNFVLITLFFSFALLSIDIVAQKKNPDIASYISALGDKDPAIRWASVDALTKIGAKAVPSLMKALADTNVSLRENAAKVLGCIGPKAAPALDALLVCLSDSDLFVNGAAADALGRIGAAAVPKLVDSLNSSNATTRWCTVIALGKIGPDAYPSVSALMRALNDSSDEVRWGAAAALGNIGGKAKPAVPALMLALSDKDQDVRWGASLALKNIDSLAVEAHTDWKSIAAIIDTLTPALMKEMHVPGVSVALISNRALIWSNQFGVASVQSGQSVTNETMFEACSMSKPVFAYIAMKLVESGKLSLDKPLVEYLDPLSFRGQQDHERITARMVLTHTSGLPNWRKGGEEQDGPLPVLFAPGSNYGYSGEGFYYLQQVVERITGEPLDLYAQRTLFDPLGLKHISFAWREEVDSWIASGHDAEGAFRQKSRYTHPNAAYTLCTSAEDYARFLIEMMSLQRTASQLLSQSSVDTILSHQVAVSSREPIERPGKARASKVCWGLGWGINITAQGDIIHHSGSNVSGFRCFSQFNPTTGSGIVIMTNGAGGSDLWTRLISRIGNL